MDLSETDLAFHDGYEHKNTMPTLTRLVLVLILIAAAIYGIMLVLVTYVEPVQTEIIIQIPAKDLKPVPISPPVTPQTEPEQPDDPIIEID
ncbi:hypothetical protein ACLBWZ_00625 [Brucellaceae bacterium C25G]